MVGGGGGVGDNSCLLQQTDPSKPIVSYPNRDWFGPPGSRVADPHHCKADPDPSFHFNADPGPDPTFSFNQSDANLTPILQDSILSLHL
jgi:hypothetical protein